MRISISPRHTHIHTSKNTPSKWRQSLDLERTTVGAKRLEPPRRRLPGPRQEVQEPPLPKIPDVTTKIRPIITLFIRCCCHQPSGFKKSSEVEDSRYVGSWLWGLVETYVSCSTSSPCGSECSTTRLRKERWWMSSWIRSFSSFFSFIHSSIHFLPTNRRFKPSWVKP